MVRGADSLESDTQGLLSQLTLLQTRLQTLLDTPAPATSTATVQETGIKQPWAQSRAAFVNWAASEKVARLAATGQGAAALGEKAEEGGALGKLREETDKLGSGRDAQVSLTEVGRRAGGTRCWC